MEPVLWRESLRCRVAMPTAWMGDPTANGYYKPTPTTIPILDRIDIIEEPQYVDTNYKSYLQLI